MIKANNIEIFKNLSQNEYCNKWIDLHNDFDCVKVILKIGGSLILWFKGIKNNEIISFEFSDVMIEKMEFFNFNKVENLTIDNLYRGKVEVCGNLLEYNKAGSGYFYLEFDEGQKLEFWSSGFNVKM